MILQKYKPYCGNCKNYNPNPGTKRWILFGEPTEGFCMAIQPIVDAGLPIALGAHRTWANLPASKCPCYEHKEPPYG